MEIITSYFLLAMLIMFIILYLIYPMPRVVVKYPSISNEISDTYIDENDVCYKYHREEIPC